LTLGRSAFAVGGVDDAELVTGSPAEVGTGVHGSANSEPFTKPEYINKETYLILAGCDLKP